MAATRSVTKMAVRPLTATLVKSGPFTLTDAAFDVLWDRPSESGELVFDKIVGPPTSRLGAVGKSPHALFTVRAAISSARRSERPACFSLFLTCSY